MYSNMESHTQDLQRANLSGVNSQKLSSFGSHHKPGAESIGAAVEHDSPVSFDLYLWRFFKYSAENHSMPEIVAQSPFTSMNPDLRWEYFSFSHRLWDI